MKKPDGAGITRGIEKQLTVYRRNRKGIGVKSATGCGTITKDIKTEVDDRGKIQNVIYIQEYLLTCRLMDTAWMLRKTN